MFVSNAQQDINKQIIFGSRQGEERRRGGGDRGGRTGLDRKFFQGKINSFSRQS